MKNRLYEDVLAMQGVKHYIANPKGNEDFEAFIKSFFNKLGIAVETQEFEIKGYANKGRNFIARMGDNPDLPVILLGAHYDTVPIAQGAEDDGSGMALMLECARHFDKLRDKVNLVFAFFDLEEAENPYVAGIRREAGLRLGIFDEDYIYKKLEYAEIEKKMMPVYIQGEPFGEAFRKAVDASGVDGNMREYLECMADAVKDFVLPNGFGENSLLGSFSFVRDNPELCNKLACALIYDEVGVASNEPHSGQIADTAIFSLADTYAIEPEKDIGNYIVMVSNKKAQSFTCDMKSAAKTSGLPYAAFAPELDYVTMLKSPLRFLLFADNAPFWDADYPVLFFTDTGHGMRGKYGHTRADTVEHMNFDFLATLTASTISAIEKFYGI